MADLKKQLYVSNLQADVQMLHTAMERLEARRDEYDALGYANITPEDLENSSLATYDPQVFIDIWATHAAFKTIHDDPGHKGNIYRVLP